MRSETMRAAVALGAAAALLCSAACEPRDEAPRASAAAPAADATAPAPGYAPLAFPAPEPGSYELPPLGDAADGALLDVDGHATALHDLLGDKIVVLSLIYAHCSDVNGCPLATAVLHQVARRLEGDPALAASLRLVSLSFDPARDTPEVMREYGAHHAGHGIDWRFMTTASEADLRPILDAYGQSLVADPEAAEDAAGGISHALRVFLIDRAGRIRNVYGVAFLHAETLLADVQTLLLEEAAGRDAPKPGPGAAAAALGPGDDKRGYERGDYATRSASLATRRGRPADLLARARGSQLGLPALPVPDENPLTREKIALGRKLFFDRRLSLNDTLSCAMCHVPEQGFANNELATAVGIEGRSVRRNAPTILNAAYASRLFHDGRETSLENQIWGPLLARNEMGNPAVGALIEKIRGLEDYAGRFEAAFPGRGLAIETLGMAIASYERALIAGDSAFDRWQYGGDERALGAAAQRGFGLFAGKAGCATCHSVGPEHATFSDGQLHNTGVGYAASMLDGAERRRVQLAPGQFVRVAPELIASVSEPVASDLGLYEITQRPADRWKYKTPTLRNVALTAPYMHDGSLPTLRDVVAFYARGGVPNEGLDPRIRPLDLAEDEIDALVAFLESLTGGDLEVLVADAFAAPVGDVRGGDAGRAADEVARQ